MYLILFCSIIAASSAATLPRSYLPANPSTGFQTPQGFGFHSSQSSTIFKGEVSGDTGNRRPQQEVEKNAAILKLDQDANENGEFHYSFETSNGIRAEESGNPTQSQGGFSYKGDDGITYTVTFTAGEGGFRPQGAHLPVAPPIPEDILKGLQQNERDEAAGIFDDVQGVYKALFYIGTQDGGLRSVEDDDCKIKVNDDVTGKYHPEKHGGKIEASSINNKFVGASTSFGSANRQGTFNSNTGYNY